MKYDKLINAGLVTIAVAGFGFGGYNIAQTVNANAKVEAHNAKIDKKNKAINAENKQRQNNLFQTQVTKFLQSSYNGDLSSASNMWDNAHNNEMFKGFETLQGSDKDFYLSTYGASVATSASDVKASVVDDNFVVSFTYTVEHNGTNASRITSQKLYVIQGHLDNNRYVADTTTAVKA
jgi:hypothetical protein